MWLKFFLINPNEFTFDKMLANFQRWNGDGGRRWGSVCLTLVRRSRVCGEFRFWNKRILIILREDHKAGCASLSRPNVT